jgi:tetratricopeptide (TPR) repeat protein
MFTTALTTFLALLARAPQTTPDILFAGTGSYQRRVATDSPLAQKFFNQGLNFLYAFNHSEARRSFEAASKIDPKCGMAWWGIAATYGPHINNPMVPPDEAKLAVAALRKANALASRMSPADRALLHAESVRFVSPQPEDRSGLDRAYAAAMKQAWAKFPKDPDVGAFYAESMMDLRPWDFWTPEGKPQPGTDEITRTLGRVLALSPNHPFALHLTIHAWEASPTPGKASAAADRLRNLQPGLGHNVHMPSHIDVRTGDWKKAILANEKAIEADNRYRTKRPRQGFYRVYMAHNRHMLGFAAMMVGQGDKAIRAMDEMVASIPPEYLKENAAFIDGYAVMPLEARLRFGKWDEILAAPMLPDYLPLSRSMQHAARGVAYAAKGMPREASAEQMMFAESRKKLPAEAIMGNNMASMILDVAEHMLDGEIRLAADDMDGALKSLRMAVRAEDQLRYDEPPDWIIPTRHVLGVALLKAGQNAEAERVYREDLKRLPNNGWSLNGLAEAMQRQGKAGAGQVRAKFLQVWQGADTPIKSSCLCVPNP